MELEGCDAAAKCAGELLHFFREHNWVRIHIQHISIRPGATFFIPDTTGVEIHPSIKPRNDEMVFQKHYPNSFRGTPLLDYLRQENITQLVVGGMMTHNCVDTTVRAANDFGIACIVAHDACATRSLQFGDRRVTAQDVQAAYMAALNGSFGRVMATKDILAEMASA